MSTAQSASRNPEQSRELPDPKTEPTIPIERASLILGVSRRAGYSAVERGEIPTITVGRRKLVPTARFLAKYDLTPAKTDPLAA
ncbi:hypothetical protein [Dactylosporangium sp. CA-139066]|uniref:hypothetical protein n=1 Tax=Dactylosporangium sp. CA-139066 TaxID=3239930 RepID=UPI003D8D7500